AENLANIKAALRARGYNTPLVADIHFTPNAAEIAARIVEKVRINPGNYVDKKKFEQIGYTDEEYAAEIERIRERFTPLVLICKEHGTAMRIGTNHGSLSDRIMSRYGDTAHGMVESAMEFLRIARSLDYHNIVLSMKSSNPLVMVQAYRLLVLHMMEEFGECYPLHLGVSEAGDGEDGRIKSAIGIGSLLEDGIGDTIRVSLTEDPEFEIPVCRDLARRYVNRACAETAETLRPAFSPYEYRRRDTHAVGRIGGNQPPVVMADFMLMEEITREDLAHIGYRYDAALDKWHIADAAADFLYTGNKLVGFELPGTLQAVCDAAVWVKDKSEEYIPLFSIKEYHQFTERHPALNFIVVEAEDFSEDVIAVIHADKTIVPVIFDNTADSMHRVRAVVNELWVRKITTPVLLAVESHHTSIDEQLIH